MATAPKKSAAAQAVSAAAPIEAAAPPNAAIPTLPELAEPAVEIQQSFRSALEKGVLESRAAFVKAKTAADEAASASRSASRRPRMARSPSTPRRSRRYAPMRRRISIS